MEFFHNPYLRILLSSVVVYIFIILMIRLFGKKELAQLSVFDLVFILLISNAVQNAMVLGDNSLVGGLIAAGALFLLNAIFKSLIFRYPKFSKVIQGDVIMLVHHGKILEENLRKARMSADELKEAIREHGVKDVSKVDLAYLEVDGNISVLSEDFSRKTIRRRKAHKVISKQT
jgi:uncharacterized membrane protein YcaP (DUF421 family)